MSDLRPVEGSPKPPSLPRRAFGKRFGREALKVGAATVMAGTQLKTTPNAEAASTHRIEPDKKEQDTEKIPFYDWTGLYQKIENLSRAETNPNLKKILDEIRIQAGDLEPDFEARAKRTTRLIELAYSTKNPGDNQPKLLKYAKQLTGNMQHVNSDEIIPFVAEKRMLDLYFRDVSALLDNMVQERPVSDPISLASLYSGLYQTLVFGNQAFPIKTEADKKREKHDDHYDIGIDPQISSTPEGQQKFSADKKRIEHFLRTYPYFKKLYTSIRLGSSLYGTPTGQRNPNVAGTFYSHRDWGTRNYRGEVSINMDHASIGPYWTENVFAHEAFGHGTDIEVNSSLQDRLDEAQVIERLAFQYEILNNPDWGAHDGNIPQLFRRFPVRRNNHHFIQNATGVTSEQILGLASEYPRNLIFFNGLLGGDSPQTIYDSVMNKPQPILPPTTSEPIKNGQPKLPIPTATPGYYPTMDAFLQDYRPKLEKAASEGSDQAKIILWGLKQFKPDFENYDIVWDPFFKDIQGRFNPTNDKSAETWSNFLNNIVLNTTLYHVFLNRDDNNEIQGLFNEYQQRQFEERILALRRMSRAELWAESNGYCHIIGDRMAETPPVRVGLAHLAAQITAP